MRCCNATRVFVLTLSATCFSSPALSQTVVEPQVAAPNAGNTPVAQVTFVDNATMDRDKLHIGPGDLVEVSLYGVAEFRRRAVSRVG